MAIWSATTLGAPQNFSVCRILLDYSGKGHDGRIEIVPALTAMLFFFFFFAYLFSFFLRRFSCFPPTYVIVVLGSGAAGLVGRFNAALSRYSGWRLPLVHTLL